MKKIVRETLNENAGQRLFRVYNTDDYGRETILLGIFQATSEKEAREKAAEKFNNREIVTTGFYDASEVSDEELEKEKKKLQIELAKLEVIY